MKRVRVKESEKRVGKKRSEVERKSAWSYRAMQFTLPSVLWFHKEIFKGSGTKVDKTGLSDNRLRSERVQNDGRNFQRRHALCRSLLYVCLNSGVTTKTTMLVCARSAVLRSEEMRDRMDIRRHPLAAISDWPFGITAQQKSHGFYRKHTTMTHY